MSGDITARKRKKKSTTRKREDDILTEQKNAPIIREKPRKREVEIRLVEERTGSGVVGRICYFFIILALLTSCGCGVYMFINNQEPDLTQFSAFVSNLPELPKSLEDLPKLSSIPDYLSRLELPSFELGAESILPNFLGSSISLPTEESLSALVSAVSSAIEQSTACLLSSCSTLLQSLTLICSEACSCLEKQFASVTELITAYTVASGEYISSLVEQEPVVEAEAATDAPVVVDVREDIDRVVQKINEDLNKVFDTAAQAKPEITAEAPVEPIELVEVVEVHDSPAHLEDLNAAVDALPELAAEASIEPIELADAVEVNEDPAQVELSSAEPEKPVEIQSIAEEHLIIDQAVESAESSEDLTENVDITEPEQLEAVNAAPKAASENIPAQPEQLEAVEATTKAASDNIPAQPEQLEAVEAAAKASSNNIPSQPESVQSKSDTR